MITQWDLEVIGMSIEAFNSGLFTRNEARAMSNIRPLAIDVIKIPEGEFDVTGDKKCTDCGSPKRGCKEIKQVRDNSGKFVKKG